MELSGTEEPTLQKFSGNVNAKLLEIEEVANVESTCGIIGNLSRNELESTFPLANSLILSKVLSFLSVNELAVSRLVSKDWKTEANLHLRNRKKVEFFGYDLKKLPDFVRVMKQSTDFPLSHFGFQIWDTESFRSRFISLPEYPDIFFSLFGPSIKHLRLGLNDFEDTVSLEDFRTWFVSSVPNLETLELSGLSYHLTSRDSIFELGETPLTFPRLRRLMITDHFGEELRMEHNSNSRFGHGFIQDLLKMAPKLSSFLLDTFDKKCSLLEAGVSALQLISPRYLSSLQLRSLLNDRELRIITACQFRLSHLELKFLESDVRRETLEGLLESQRSTLTVLVIGEAEAEHEDLGKEIMLDFPCMTRLRDLSVFRRTSASRKILFRANTYSKKLPVLQKLSLRMKSGSHVSDFIPDPECPERHLSLKKLELPQEFSDAGLCERIFQQFPRLSSLRAVYPSKAVLRTIWELGTELEELELHLNLKEDLDSILTGLPTKICEWIGEDRAYFRLNQNFMEVVGRKSSIYSLKKLQKLHIVIQPQLEFTLSDVTGYLAFIDLNALTSLTLKNCGISAQCLEALTKKIPYLRLNV